MDFSSVIEPSSTAASGSTPPGAVIIRQSQVAPSSLASGFGVVMEQERDLRAATESSLGVVKGPRSADINRLLRDQQHRLEANIALLEQRYELLSNPERIQAAHPRLAPVADPQRATVIVAEAGPLPALVAQHLTLLKNIEALIAQRPDGQRGELILTTVVRNHEDMAWMLTSLLKEDESVRGLEPVPAITAVAKEV